jgi:hypothetical protein
LKFHFAPDLELNRQLNDDDGTSPDAQAVPHPIHAETTVVVGVAILRIATFVNAKRNVLHQEIQSFAFRRVTHSSTSLKVQTVKHRPRLSWSPRPEHK